MATNFIRKSALYQFFDLPHSCFLEHKENLLKMHLGLDDQDGASLQVSNMVRDAIKPDLTMFLHYETLTVDGKKIVAVDIQQGTERPDDMWTAAKTNDRKRAERPGRQGKEHPLLSPKIK